MKTKQQSKRLRNFIKKSKQYSYYKKVSGMGLSENKVCENCGGVGEILLSDSLGFVPCTNCKVKEDE